MSEKDNEKDLDINEKDTARQALTENISAETDVGAPERKKQSPSAAEESG